MSKHLNRRKFIKTGLKTALAVNITRNIRLYGKNDRKVKLGFIGVGSRGTAHLRRSLSRADVEVPAICDINIDNLSRALSMVEKSGGKKPEGYSRGDEDFRRMAVRDDLDGIIISTPWEWHAPMAVASMKAGKYAGVEVPAAISIEECWELVNTSESTGIPCMILENDCYDRPCMAVLNMVRQGILGELIHAECGYQHDVRRGKIGSDGEIKWRGQHSVERNADLYPTHGIGPIANCLDIDVGNRFVYLTSTATKSRGINYYAAKNFGPDHPNAVRKYALGDIVTTVIKCHNGETVTINHDTNSPRPHDQMYRVQGTKGIWWDNYTSINRGQMYIEDISPNEPRPAWESFDKYREKYEHPMWKKYGEEATGAGHGGIDFFVTNAFIEAVKRKMPTPINVYNAASWSVITPLSEQSISRGTAKVMFPDFTRGKWKTNNRVFGLTDEY